MNNETFAIKDDFSNDLEVRYTNNNLRFVITDTLPWTDDEATTAHLAIISARADSYLQIARSDHFRQRYPGTLVTVVLRFHHDPTPPAKMVLSEISKRLASDGMRFLHGMVAG
ncbi:MULTISPECIES: DUF6572 domain-containing protein [unclassified Mesorhizobium]|uniref:DUF6572 domain-containing protein n=1 Tax=unclassified Mesorhizobium TaxID=325217 RepID=UPI00333DEA26